MFCYTKNFFFKSDSVYCIQKKIKKLKFAISKISNNNYLLNIINSKKEKGNKKKTTTNTNRSTIKVELLDNNKAYRMNHDKCSTFRK